MKKKFKLTDKTKTVSGRNLYQIEALYSFGEVKAGDLGGWLEDENSLSHGGEAWVFEAGIVFKHGTIRGGTIRGGTIWGGTIWGGTIVTRTVVTILGLRREITITDNHISIDCQTRAFAFWKNATSTDIKKMDYVDLDWWKENKAWILKLAEEHENKEAQ